MSNALTARFYNAYLTILMLTNPARLFARLQSMPWYSAMLNSWIDSLNIANQKSANILEVGCGPALFSYRLSQSGKRVTALDNSSKMIKFAKQNFSNSQLHLIQGSAHRLPFTDNSFDAVLSASLISIIPNPQQAMAEMRRVTKPGGVISCLVASTQMTLKNANSYIKQNHLDGFDAAALRLWSSRAPSMNTEQLAHIVQPGGIADTMFHEELSGLVLCMTLHLNR